MTKATYLGIGMIGLALRLVALGGEPLTESEAKATVVALYTVGGGHGAGLAVAEAPLLHNLQVLNFWMFGAANEALARWWPAVAGSLIVFAPALFRKEIGDRAAVVTATLLAISPTLVASSRTANASTMALVCIVGIMLGAKMFDVGDTKRATVVTASALGAGLATGGSFLSGCFVLAAAWIMVPLEDRRRIFARARPQLANMLTLAGLVFIVSATAALTYKLGLSGAGESWVEWYSRWWTEESESTSWTPVQLLVIYEPLALVMGLFGAVGMVVRRAVVRSCIAMALVGIAYCVIWPGGGSADILWCSVPLTVLAGYGVMNAIRGRWSKEEKTCAGLQAAGLLVYMTIVYTALAGYVSGASVSWDGLGLGLWGLVIVLVALGVLIWLVFNAAWDRAMVRRGGLAALATMVSGYSLTVLLSLAQPRADHSRGLWSGPVASPSLELLVESLGDISSRTTGDSHSIPITVAAKPGGLLEWELREFHNVEWVDEISNGAEWDVIITSSTVDTDALRDSYTGQEFAYIERRSRGLQSVTEWIEYTIFRRVPMVRSDITLWAHEDLWLK